MPSGWRPVWSVWSEYYSSQALLPASDRTLDYRAAAESAGHSSLIPYHQVHLLQLCPAWFPADALNWLKPSVQSYKFYTYPCKVIITTQFLFSQAELGVAWQRFETGSYWISVGFKKNNQSVYLTTASVNVTWSSFSMRYFEKKRQNHKGIKSHCFTAFS